MIKNRTTQLVYLSAGCAIGVIAILASFGLFDASFRWDFYIHFTNISNYLCIFILIKELIDVIKSKENNYIKTMPVLKFVGLLAIILTFGVYNFVLAPTKSVKINFSVFSVSLHIIIPILYILDWILFYDRTATWKYPLYSLIFPAVYIIFVFIHAACLNFNSSIINFAGTGPLIYPYFFLNIDKLGIGGVLIWILIITIAFIIIGYLMYFIDKLILKNRKNTIK